MKIIVASENVVKTNATQEAFEKFFSDVEVTGVAVPSGVPDQPFGEETFQGAKNRVKNLIALAKSNKTGAEMFVGIEGGVQNLFGKWFAFGAVCIGDLRGRYGYGLSPHFELPEKIIDELKNGAELGHVIDKISAEKDTKRKGGAIGYLTRGVYNRKNLYVNAVIMALVPFLNETIFGLKNGG